ncbi:TetR family transcriptional regulator [Photobacterium indicum]|jgi:hypothetical protein|uniref:TetR family transcriptional regulator n=2 Tax=Photobacterium indicum TaxID=81447 RepID=A0A2T3L731_9GAMM|nr:TetR family transcriptional regulator [Photobacterium indicum]
MQVSVYAYILQAVCGKKMPRVSQKVALQTRKRIIEAALDIVVNQGSENLTFSILAKKADISRSGINSHFKLKSDLMSEIRPQIASRIQMRLNYSSPEDFYMSWTKAVDTDVEFCRLIIASGAFIKEQDGFESLIKTISSSNIEITKMYIYQAIGYAVVNIEQTLKKDVKVPV